MRERFETFTVLINRIGRSIRRIKNSEMAEYGLKSAHISCLYYLYSVEGLTASELCERCEEDKATVSRALRALREMGYITFEKRYKSPIVLTEKGRETGKQIAEKINRVLESIGQNLREDERQQFYRYLSLISDGLESIAKN